MDTEHTFARDEVLPSWWANALGKFLSVGAFNFLLSKTDGTHLAVPAGAGVDAAAIAVEGLWRFVEAPASRAHPGGAAGPYDVYVTAKANGIQGSPAPYTDDTDYSFALWIGAAGATPPIVAGSVDVVRRVGSCQWDGTKITRVDQLVPVVGPHAIAHHTGGSDQIAPADIGAASETELTAETARAEAAEGTLSDAVTAETARAEAAEGANAAAITAETGRAEAAEGLLMTRLDPQTSAAAAPNVAPFTLLSCTTADATPKLPAAPTDGMVCAVRAGIAVSGGHPLVIQGNGNPIWLPERTVTVITMILGEPGAVSFFYWSSSQGAWIATLEDTGWVPLTYDNTKWISEDPDPPKVRRINQRVYFSGALVSSAIIPANGQIVSVPAGYGMRPSASFNLSVNVYGNAAPSPVGAFSIDNAGKVSCVSGFAALVGVALNGVEFSLDS